MSSAAPSIGPLGPDNRIDLGAKILVGQPDYDRFCHCRMGKQSRFDFGRIDVPPARKDQVGAAVGDIEVAVPVQPAEIAEAFEPVAQPPLLAPT